jgi:hypothetical protein
MPTRSVLSLSFLNSFLSWQENGKVWARDGMGKRAHRPCLKVKTPLKLNSKKKKAKGMERKERLDIRLGIFQSKILIHSSPSLIIDYGLMVSTINRTTTTCGTLSTIQWL